MEEVLPYVTYCSQEFKEKRKESAFFIEIAKALTSRAFDNRDKNQAYSYQRSALSLALNVFKAFPDNRVRGAESMNAIIGLSE